MSETATVEELKQECENVSYGSKEYWELRCKYLEESEDSTIIKGDRDNAYKLYRILKHRTL